MEIERKYLIEKVTFDLSGYKKLIIKQGYISTDPVVRLRQSKEDFILTVKGKGNLYREEFELQLTEDQFHKLWKKVENTPIEKIRHLIPLEDKYTIELDIFLGKHAGLVLAEVEFEYIEEANTFIAPDWFGLDVTEDCTYKNSYLSRNS